MKFRSVQIVRAVQRTCALVLTGLATSVVAGAQTPAAPKPAPPVPAPMPAVMPAPDAMPSSDSAAMARMAMPMPMAAPPVPTPKPRAAGWPVDANGRTLINGQPVIGRVFVQQKVDGLIKYDFANVYTGEAAHPLPPIVGTRHNIPAPRNSRRIRTGMVQATLWSMDKKRSARELQTYRMTTTGSR